MKVALIANTIMMHERFNRMNIELLQSLGHEVTLISNVRVPKELSESVNAFKIYCQDHKVHLEHIDIPRIPFHLQKLLKAYYGLLDLLSKERISFVHSHSPSGGILGRLASHKLGIKNIYTAHGFHFYRGAPLINWILYYPIEKWLAKKTTAIITINTEDYTTILDKFQSKVFYVPGVGVETNLFNVTKTSSKSPVRLISVGELNRNKNHSFVIRQLYKVKQDFNYQIAGVGQNETSLNRLINKLGLDAKVSLMGYQTNIIEVLQSFDIFIMPSIREGLPVAMMEAMAAGLPILANNIRGIRELVDHGRGGYLYDSSKPSEFLFYLTKLIENEELRRRMSSYNQSKIREYDTQIVNEKMRQIYSGFLG